MLVLIPAPVSPSMSATVLLLEFDQQSPDLKPFSVVSYSFLFCELSMILRKWLDMLKILMNDLDRTILKQYYKGYYNDAKELTKVSKYRNSTECINVQNLPFNERKDSGEV